MNAGSFKNGPVNKTLSTFPSLFLLGLHTNQLLIINSCNLNKSSGTIISPAEKNMKSKNLLSSLTINSISRGVCGSPRKSFLAAIHREKIPKPQFKSE